MPVIFAGLRVVTVSNIALVSVAVLVGSGALGKLFDLGFSSFFYTPIIVGLVLTLVLALILDAIILLIQRGTLPWARRRRTHEHLQLPARPGQLERRRRHRAAAARSTCAYTGAAVAHRRRDRGSDRHPHRPHRARLVPGHRREQRARAIPSLGLLVLVVLLLGTGALPIIGVLAILALPSILTATAAGVQGADPEAVLAARALGMSSGQIVGKVEVPLALPLIISGLRSATLQVVATATIAGFTARRRARPAADPGNASPELPADVRRRRCGRRCWPSSSTSLLGVHRLAGRPPNSSRQQDRHGRGRGAYIT